MGVIGWANVDTVILTSLKQYSRVSEVALSGSIEELKWKKRLNIKIIIFKMSTQSANDTLTKKYFSAYFQTSCKPTEYNNYSAF